MNKDKEKIKQLEREIEKLYKIVNPDNGDVNIGDDNSGKGDLGYYILTADGAVHTFGNAQFFGSLYDIPNAPNKTPVSIAITPNGGGYYILTADGAVYTFGDAQFNGSLYDIPSSAIPNRTPVAFALAPSGNGYYKEMKNMKKEKKQSNVNRRRYL